MKFNVPSIIASLCVVGAAAAAYSYALPGKQDQVDLGSSAAQSQDPLTPDLPVVSQNPPVSDIFIQPRSDIAQPRMSMMPPMSADLMIQDDMFIYIKRGATIFKIDKANMQVSGWVNVPVGPMTPPPGRPDLGTPLTPPSTNSGGGVSK